MYVGYIYTKASSSFSLYTLLQLIIMQAMLRGVYVIEFGVPYVYITLWLGFLSLSLCVCNVTKTSPPPRLV